MHILIHGLCTGAARYNLPNTQHARMFLMCTIKAYLLTYSLT